MVGDDTSKWVRVLMRLPKDAAPVAYYNIASGNDVRAYPERNPVAWVLEASEDGVNWTTLDDRNFEVSRIAYVNKTWFNGGKMFPVHVTSNRAPAFETNRRYFRFNIRAKSVMSHGNFEMSELALYDVCGNRVNLNLTNVGNSKGASALTPGSFTFQENGSAGRGETDNEASQKVFDGNVDTKAFIGGLNKTAEPWPCFIMRLADDAAPVAAYGLATGNDTASTGRTPVSWSLEDSEDGESWRTVAEESNALESGLLVNANRRWANNGFPIGLSSGERCLAPTEATVSVSDGATLVLPTEQGAGLSHLVVDCTSAGTIENFKAAEGMTLDVINFRAFKRGGAVRAGKALPIRFVGEVDLSTVMTWTVRLDDKPSRCYNCTVSDGAIVIQGGPGVVLILR